MIRSCPVKENSLFELIDSLHKNTLLERFELNINNVVINVNDLVKVCENLINRLKFCHVVIYALQYCLPDLGREGRPFSATRPSSSPRASNLLLLIDVCTICNKYQS